MLVLVLRNIFLGLMNLAITTWISRLRLTTQIMAECRVKSLRVMVSKMDLFKGLRSTSSGISSDVPSFLSSDQCTGILDECRLKTANDVESQCFSSGNEGLLGHEGNSCSGIGINKGKAHKFKSPPPTHLTAEAQPNQKYFTPGYSFRMSVRTSPFEGNGCNLVWSEIVLWLR